MTDYKADYAKAKEEYIAATESFDEYKDKFQGSDILNDAEGSRLAKLRDEAELREREARRRT